MLVCLGVSLVYFVMFALTLFKYGKVIQRLNKWLLYSSAVEASLRVAHGLSVVIGDPESIGVLAIDIMLQSLFSVNFVLFLNVIFRLKTISIYLDDNNMTKSQIKAQLLELKQLKFGYLSFYGSYVALDFIVDNVR